MHFKRNKHVESYQYVTHENKENSLKVWMTKLCWVLKYSFLEWKKPENAVDRTENKLDVVTLKTQKNNKNTALKNKWMVWWELFAVIADAALKQNSNDYLMSVDWL